MPPPPSEVGHGPSDVVRTLGEWYREPVWLIHEGAVANNRRHCIFSVLPLSALLSTSFMLCVGLVEDNYLVHATHWAAVKKIN